MSRELKEFLTENKIEAITISVLCISTILLLVLWLGAASEKSVQAALENHIEKPHPGVEEQIEKLRKEMRAEMEAAFENASERKGLWAREKDDVNARIEINATEIEQLRQLLGEPEQIIFE